MTEKFCKSKECRAFHLHWLEDKHHNFTIRCYACFCAPYWGKRVEAIDECPEFKVKWFEEE